MKTFQDNQQRDWSIEINVTAIKRVRDLAGVDLMTAIDGELLDEFSRDPIKLVDVIYVLCKPEADRLSVTDEDFGRAMGGDAIDRATTSFLEELVAFFPSLRRKTFRRLLEKVKALEIRAADSALETINGTLLDRLIEAKLKTTNRTIEEEIERLGTLSGSAPGSSASTPAR